MSRRRTIVITIVAALVLLSFGVFYWKNPWNSGVGTQVGTTTSVSLRLKWLYDPSFAGEMVAAKAGIFEKCGIKVEIKPGGFESDPVKLVAAGADNIGNAGADSFLIARSKGIPIVAIAGGFLETGVAFYVHADSDITSPKDFAGKKVGYQAGQDTATIYEALMRKQGVDRTSIKEIPVKYDFSPFLQRQVDVWPGYAATQAYVLEREKIPYRQFRPLDYGLSYLGIIYFTTEDYLAKNPKVIDCFVKGLVEGWTLTYDDYQKSIPLIGSYDPKTLTPDLIRFNLDRQKPSVLPSGYRYAEYHPEQWASLQRILLDAGLISTSLDLERAVTYEPLQRAYAK
jgi:NitT/TauT family transport system substrate-binding protein